ncbi:MAG: GLUG motif-containing protein, partial [Candidatus Saliniplasma sp.]
MRRNNIIPGRANKLMAFFVTSVLVFSLLTAGTIASSEEENDDLTSTNGLNAKLKDFTEGDGSEDDPYMITNVTELQSMNEDLSAHYALANDINADDTSGWDDEGFEPVGTSSSSFTGTFDGRNHSIKGLYINRPSTDYVGLFGQIGSNSEVKHVELIDVEVSGNDRVGALVGRNYDGSVLESYVDGDISGNLNVGGLVGYNDDTVSKSSASGIVRGNSNVGGLIGKNYGEDNNGLVTYSSSTGNVSGVENRIGGLIGHNAFGTLSNSSADSEVMGDEDVGGLVGYNEEGTYWPGVIENSYSLGKLNGNTNVGGLVGYNNYAQVHNSYTIVNVTGNTNVGGLVGEDFYGSGTFSESYWNTETTGQVNSDAGTGLTTSNMTWPYSDGAYNGWDMEPIGTHTNEAWISGDHMMVFDHLGNYGYPALGWEEDIGIEENPYHITNWYELDAVRNFLGNSFAVDNDLNETNDGYDELVDTTDGFLPIGNSSDPFGGNFDGRNFTVLDLFIDRNETDYVGLFGNINESATLRNLGLKNANVTGRMCVGTLAGQNYGMIKRSHALGNVSGYTRVGGLVGRNRGLVDNSYAVVTVYGDDESEYIGGLIGTNSDSNTDYSEVNNSFAKGDVNGYKYVGGLNGGNWGSESYVLNSYATGTINGTLIVGGNVGYNYLGKVNRSYAIGNVNGTSSVGGMVGDNRGIVSQSYATGEVTGENSVGGFVGYNYQGKVTRCYSTGRVLNDSASDSTDSGFVGAVDTGGDYEMSDNYWDILASEQSSSPAGKGLLTCEMMGNSSKDNMTGFDFTNTWNVFDNGTWISYPYLKDNPQIPYPGLIKADDVENPFAGGDGTKSNPYLIENWTHLHHVRLDLDANYTLVDDIDETTDGYETVVNTTGGFEPIGDWSDRFTGSF